ncbi:hypothetical protein CP960_04895 [Malaciobacter halophilus]|uniref:N-acyl amino acid synthase FeeM catalytic core domain-containing protein n=1 Tax=Malaciobacter halophilus TaxID=197482 RepID=A0A2N1J456_9BACT|nr:hypothetical protein [Malaciobacter halophilus]AXH10272.1 hypothetical protein AHALO_1911 [Malaciobacter halophilus]PKI81294.1 hypothetical protein CP960_04895 [Malaciobacter halophilus]
MFNINKNSSLEQLQVLLTQNVSRGLEYLPQEFKKEQLKAFETFKKRVFLETIIDKTISFNKSLNFETEQNSLHLALSAEELLNIFKLRSDIYTKLNYNSEFPEIIEGLNFDKYDQNSAIIYTKTDNFISGTCRLIFDSKKKLPIEEKLNLNYLKHKHKNIAEVSRLIINNNSGLNLDFKKLTLGIYLVLIQNDLKATISVISKDHFKLYSKFGGFKIEKDLSSYGKLNSNFVITSWDISNVSKFFKKAFLK